MLFFLSINISQQNSQHIMHLYKKLTLLSFNLKTFLPHLYNPNLSFSSLPQTPKSLAFYYHLISKHGFSPEMALKASAIVRHVWTPQKSDSTLSFLEQNGFSKTHIEKCIKLYPKFLSCKPETIKSKLKMFQGLGFAPNEVVDIISSNPWYVTKSTDKQLKSILLLKNIVGTNTDIYKVIKRSHWFLHHDLHKTLIPNIEFLKCCGADGTQIAKMVVYFPRLFTIKPETMKALIERVDELGFDRKSNMFLYAVSTMSSLTRENLERKLQLFQSLGWSEDDVWLMFRKKPQMFTVTDSKIREVVSYLFSQGNYNASYLVHNPELLSYSVEGRLKPRMQIIQILVSKNLIPESTNLASVCKMTNAGFFKRYVVPNANEVGDLYATSQTK